uniref:Secreted protein n=1 Tax=Opuntia streptacantha TaxID=393608 RepID=A0A7C8YC69_OPUST
MIVVTPLLLRSASFLAMASVPTANLSNSKTPIGPFQIMVWVVSKASLNFLTESGPMSNPIQPSGIAEAGTILLFASGANLSAMMTSEGSKRETPLALAFARSDVARSSLSSSTREDPTERPCAL